MKVENIQIRRMHVRDLAGVLEIERQAFAMPWTSQMFLNEIAAAGESVPLVAHLGGRLVGYAILWLVGTRLHVANIAVEEGSRRLGIGTLLVRRAFVEARNRRCRRTSLETRASNRAAIDLFRTLGFRTVAISHGYYTDNDEDALVMVRAIEAEGKREESPSDAECQRNARLPE
jgi:ribosomal-protein-alanine N-acetyltransferase